MAFSDAAYARIQSFGGVSLTSHWIVLQQGGVHGYQKMSLVQGGIEKIRLDATVEVSPVRLGVTKEESRDAKAEQP